ncbi:MAG: hypothetical protein H6Q10_2769, partial [Acidobacteria bacterium]|nr:hypothetical protein [Acidobacteriota bacterium]
MASEWILVSTGSLPPRLFLCWAGGTLLRQVTDPLVVVGSGFAAGDAWSRSVVSPLAADRSAENLLADLCCINALGLDVSGVGGVPAYARMAGGTHTFMDARSATVLTNMGGLYLTGRVDRAWFMKFVADALRTPARFSLDESPVRDTQLGPDLSPLMPLGPFPYSFWQKLTFKRRQPALSCGPYEIAGEGLRKNASSKKDRAPSEPLALSQMDELRKLVRVKALDPEAVARCVPDPDAYSSDRHSRAQMVLGYYVRTAPVLHDAAWLIDPFAKLALRPLYAYLAEDCRRRGSGRASAQFEVLFDVWMDAVRDAWRADAELLPHPDGSLLQDVDDVFMFVRRHEPRHEVPLPQDRSGRDARDEV